MQQPQNNPIPKQPNTKAGDRISAGAIQRIADGVTRLARSQYAPLPLYQNTQEKFDPLFKRSGTEEEPLVEVALVAGYFVEQKMHTQPPVQHEISGINYDPLADYEWHSIEDGQCVFVEAEIDEYGHVISIPEIKVQSESYAPEPYRPKAGEYAGAEGKHIVKICKVEIGDVTVKATQYYSGADIVFYSQRPAINNYAISGSGNTYNLVKDWDKGIDEYKIRPITQLDDEGEPIIKPDANPLLRDDIPFKRIREKEEAEIRVSTVGDAVQIEGNGVDIDSPLVVADGLVKSLTGVYGDFSWCMNGYSLTLGFENGILVSASGNNGSGSGTQADPYNYSIED